MAKFAGFKTKKGRHTALPDAFFLELLGQIEDAAELKLLLYFFWRLDRKEGRFPYLTDRELRSETNRMGLTDPDGQPDLEALDRAIKLCTSRGTVLTYNLDLDGRSETLYFLNSPRGRAAVAGLASGDWSPKMGDDQPLREYSNIFQLYEENFGPLTPMISEALAEAEESYPLPWIEEAMRISVENNVRRWRYVEAILRSWHDKGKDEGQSRKGAEEDRHKYIRGEFSEFIEH